MAKDMRDWKLEVTEAPDKSRSGIYDHIVDEFIAAVLENKDAAADSAKVIIPGRATKTVQVGLSKAAHAVGRSDIMVSIRGGEIWLIRK